MTCILQRQGADDAVCWDHRGVQTEARGSSGGRGGSRHVLRLLLLNST